MTGIVWQDMVVAGANLLFAYSILTQVVHGFREKKGFILLRTSGPTTLGLYAMAVAFFTIPLFYSASVAAFNATLWLLLFIQRLIYEKA